MHTSDNKLADVLLETKCFEKSADIADSDVLLFDAVGYYSTTSVNRWLSAYAVHAQSVVVEEAIRQYGFDLLKETYRLYKKDPSLYGEIRRILINEYLDRGHSVPPILVNGGASDIELL
jgi:hypothetical protein